MVAPFVSKPKTVTLKRFVVDDSGTPYEQQYYLMQREGVSQKPPYVNTEMTVNIYEALNQFTDGMSWAVSPDESVAATMAANAARAKFVSKLGDSSSFGSTLTSELKTTWGTVVSGLTSALQAAKAVSRGNMLKAASILGFYPPVERIRKSKRRKRRSDGKYTKRIVTLERWVMPDGRRIVKNSANRWLWYSYGVKPLVTDIYNGMDVLTREHPASTTVRASGSARTQKGPFDASRVTYQWQSSVRISAVVSVDNPNLWLANQLGLINPVQWINEGIPFSFVIDWFSNLSQIISQMTDFVGLSIAEPLTTSKHVVNETSIHTYYRYTRHKRWTQITRKLAIPEAKLIFAYERFQWQRGANAISLLIGFLGSSTKGR